MNDIWKYSAKYNSICRVIETVDLWGETVCRIWLPETNSVVRVPVSDLSSIPSEQLPSNESHRIAYISAAAKIADLVESAANLNDSHIPLAPMESNVIPLPHQIHALQRAISGDKVRYLLADEVGLGKTIEAGLVMRELKLRGLVRRTLVMVPKSLAMQWIAEMDTHFNETFHLINPSDLDTIERLEGSPQYEGEQQDQGNGYNPWLKVSQAIVTLDSVKPITRRKGWTKDKVLLHNQNRYERLLQGEWDLLIVDESHKLGGSTDQVARYKLGQGLAEAVPHLLLLSATPHQGKSDAFRRLMGLLDPMSFPDEESITRESVAEYVIRTEKRKAVTAEGKPLFLPRITETIEIDLEQSAAQMELYNAVTEYVKEGYNQAIKDRKPHIGFLMVLLQRIATSSTHAIRCTLERRLEVLKNLKARPMPESDVELEELIDLDGQMQLDFLIEIDEFGRARETMEVHDLLEFAKAAEAAGPDVKTEKLMHLLFQLQGEENEDELKLILFTEFVPTQAMLKDYLEERGITCAIINGSMSMDERRLAQREFRDSARVLISTDAGGEGLNLQFCHVVINYDLPWNPMRIEQRIGRVDRIGQDKVVRAINFVYENSVESRVREVIKEKLSIIMKEMGIDKAKDVLDTSVTGDAIEEMMRDVIMGGADLDEKAAAIARKIEEEMRKAKKDFAIFNISDEPDLTMAEKLRGHPLPFWTERMTLHYLQCQGCSIEKNLLGWNFTWPDGTTVEHGVFQAADLTSDRTLLSLENPRIHELIANIPQLFPGNPVAEIAIDGLMKNIRGLWGLFEVQVSIPLPNNAVVRIPSARQGYYAVFLSDEGKLFLPTAIHIWDQLLSEDIYFKGILDPTISAAASEQLMSAAESAGEEYFNALKERHFAALEREKERGATLFKSRRRAINRIGLPEVRNYRVARLTEEEERWKEELRMAEDILPEIRPLLMLYISERGTNG